MATKHNIFAALKALVECPDYRNINTVEMQNARDIVDAGEHRPIHVRDMAPVMEQDIIVNLDNELDRKAVDNGRGVAVARLLVWQNGKRQVGWVGVGFHNNRAVLRITVGNKNRSESKKDIKFRPWLDAVTANDAPEGK